MTHPFIAPNLLVGEEQNISIRKNKKSLITAIALLIIGVASGVAMVTLPSGSLEFLPFTLGLISAISIVIGIFQLIFTKKTYTYEPTKSPIQGRFFFCNSGHGQETISAIKSKDWAHLQKLITGNDSSVKVEFITSEDKTFARCQVSTFVPYNFEPLSDVIVLSPEEIEDILKVTGTKL